MGSWWRMISDDGHQWELLEESDAESAESDLRCRKDGLPAVTVMRLPLADRAIACYARRSLDVADWPQLGRCCSVRQHV
jgi:hypothetical protein